MAMGISKSVITRLKKAAEGGTEIEKHVDSQKRIITSVGGSIRFPSGEK